MRNTSHTAPIDAWLAWGNLHPPVFVCQLIDRDDGFTFLGDSMALFISISPLFAYIDSHKRLSAR